MSKAAAAYETLKTQESREQGCGDWLEIDQAMIDAFADCTFDHQFIHVDPERAAAETPFGGTIAHGLLTLSMLPHLTRSLPAADGPIDGAVMGINYGFDRVRFVHPVNSGRRVRARAAVKSVELKGSAVDQVRTVTVEIDGADKPALVADWVTRIVFES